MLNSFKQARIIFRSAHTSLKRKLKEQGMRIFTTITTSTGTPKAVKIEGTASQIPEDLTSVKVLLLVGKIHVNAIQLSKKFFYIYEILFSIVLLTFFVVGLIFIYR